MFEIHGTLASARQGSSASARLTRLLGEVVDGPPAQRPCHTHGITAEQCDWGALGVLQQQR